MDSSQTPIRRFAKLLLSWRGRLPRRQFWFAVLVVVVGGAFTSQRQDTIGTLAALLTLYVAFASYGKRLHDFDRAAWYMVVPVGATLAFQLYAVAEVQEVFASGNLSYERITALQRQLAFGWSVVGLLWVGVTMALGIMPGNRGDNRYGVSPREERALPPAPLPKAAR